MMHWVFLPFRRYAEFSGRSRRLEYWSFALFNAFVVFALLFATGGFAALAERAAQGADPSTEMMALFSGAGLLVALYALLAFIPSVAVTIRRLHDRDLSGWWYLGAIVGSLIPILGFLVSIAFLVVLLLPGTPGTNRFGPDPKEQGEVEVME